MTVKMRTLGSSIEYFPATVSGSDIEEDGWEKMRKLDQFIVVVLYRGLAC